MGILDDVFRDLSSDLIGTLGTTAVTFTRVTRIHDPRTDRESPTTTTGTFKISPPERFNTGRVDGSTILATDLMSLVSAKDLDDDGFDMTPADDATITVEFGGVTYAVVGVGSVYSGDLVAAYELQLRTR